jgi:hypothetical protein
MPVLPNDGPNARHRRRDPDGLNAFGQNIRRSPCPPRTHSIRSTMSPAARPFPATGKIGTKNRWFL